MSDWKREDDLDVPLSPAHRLLDARMEAIERDLIEHTHPQIERIIELLDGPLVEDLDGNFARDPDVGLRQAVERVNSKIDRVLEQQSHSSLRKIIAAFTGGVGVSALTVWTKAWELIS